ncbi:MAG: HWE histidine kinase domain-containing protein [Hyphomonadaceae bacterium]
MAELLPDMAWIANTRGRIVWGNQRWRDYVGATPETIGDTDWSKIHDPAFLPKVQEMWATALATGDAAEMAFPLRAADGQFRMFLTRARPIRNASGNVTHWLGVNIDVRALHAATEALSEQKRMLEVLNRTAASIASELNLERLLQMVTDVGVEITGAAFGAFFYNVLTPEGLAYQLYTISGVERANFEKFPMPRSTQVFAPTFNGTGVVRSDDITVDPRYGHNAPFNGMPKGHLPVRSYLAVPIISRSGEVLGGLLLGHPEANIFNPSHEQLVVGIAAQAAIGIDNSRLYDNAQREIEERRQAEEDRLIVLRELNHRVKNVFAVAIGMIAMTERTSDTKKQMAERLTGRLRALAAAHELIRPKVSSDNQQLTNTSVTTLIDRILAPHVGEHSGQIVLDLVDASAGPTGATGLALVLHELATNAVKYGSLSIPGGRIDIASRIADDTLTITWIERGGPIIGGVPQHKGFGEALARMSARGQLGGDITYLWNPGGVEITIRASLSRLAV